jgi:hypothetical protein
MSDTFAFRALPVPLRRRVNVRVVKAVVAGCLVVATVGAFARWTIRSEQESLATAARHAVVPDVDAGQGAISTVDGLLTSGVVAISTADLQAQDVARHTLSRAQHLFSVPGSLTEAGPGQLARHSKGVTFTDGPSIAPSIASVAGTNAAWGAAVMSESGLCFAVRLDADGAVRYGTLSSACTGAAALQVTGVRW